MYTVSKKNLFQMYEIELVIIKNLKN